MFLFYGHLRYVFVIFNESVSFSKRQWFRHEQKFLDGSLKRQNANGKQIIEAEDPFQSDEDNNGVTLFSVTLAKTIFQDTSYACWGSGHFFLCAFSGAMLTRQHSRVFAGLS